MERFPAALLLAERVHHDQRRKGTGIPYIAHVMAVAALVLEHGGDEDEAIAALLHDAAEDAGGEAMLAEIRAQFGDAVGDIVLGCSDSLVENPAEKRPWLERKAKAALGEHGQCLVCPSAEDRRAIGARGRERPIDREEACLGRSRTAPDREEALEARQVGPDRLVDSG